MELWFHSGVWALTPTFVSSPSLLRSLPSSFHLLLLLSALFEPSETCSWSWKKGSLVNVQVWAFVKAIILHNTQLSWQQVESEPWKQWYWSHPSLWCFSTSTFILCYRVKQIRCNVIHKRHWGRKEIHNISIINSCYRVNQGCSLNAVVQFC